VTEKTDLSARAARFVPAGPTSAIPPQTDEIVEELTQDGPRELCHCLRCGRQVVAIHHPSQCLVCGSEAVMVEES